MCLQPTVSQTSGLDHEAGSVLVKVTFGLSLCFPYYSTGSLLATVTGGKRLKP